MKRYVMTAKRKAALRKAQLASARKRRGKGGKSSTAKKMAARAVGQGIVAAGFGVYAYQSNKKRSQRHPPVAVPTMSRNASRAQPALPGRTRALDMKPRPGRKSRINMSRASDPMSPYYTSRMERGRNLKIRGMRQAPPLRPAGVFTTNSRGVTVVGRGKTMVRSTGYSPGAIGYPRNKRQQKAYLAKKSGVSRSMIQY
jgi:hypothetical protein